MAKLDRLLENTQLVDSGCLIWLGYINEEGYPRTNNGGISLYVHRLVFELSVSAIPKGMTLDHICHNEDTACEGGNSCIHRRCVRPEHLRPRTIRDNLLQSKNAIAAIHATRTHCPRGHEYAGNNLYINTRGSRECRACRKINREARLGKIGLSDWRE